MSIFSTNLRLLRSQKNVSQQEVANYLQITKQGYSLYEIGNRQPDFETLLKLSEYFGVTVDFLLRGSSEDGQLPEELILLNRAGKKMNPEKRKKLLEMARLMFKEDFDE